jgi:hypothetical protein
MSSGLRNAAQTFQCFMEEVRGGGGGATCACGSSLDDILVVSRSLEDHERHLRALFGRLQTYGIIINPVKCIFRTSGDNFLDTDICRLSLMWEVPTELTQIGNITGHQPEGETGERLIGKTGRAPGGHTGQLHV